MKIAQRYTAEVTNALMKWLSRCRAEMVEGRPVLPDPYCAVVITPEQVDGALTGLERYIWSEIRNAGNSHAAWQQQRSNGRKLAKADLKPPRFRDLPYDQQLGVVQGAYRALNPYRSTPQTDAEEEAKA